MINDSSVRGGGHPTWAWLSAAFLGIIMLMVGFTLSATRETITSHAAQMKLLEEKKLDKESYYRDHTEIKSDIKSISSLLLEIRADQIRRQRKE